MTQRTTHNAPTHEDYSHKAQKGILEPTPPMALFTLWTKKEDVSWQHALQVLQSFTKTLPNHRFVMGLGMRLLQAFGDKIPNMHDFEAIKTKSIDVLDVKSAFEPYNNPFIIKNIENIDKDNALSFKKHYNEGNFNKNDQKSDASDIMLWLRAADCATLFFDLQQLYKDLSPCFELTHTIESFKHGTPSSNLDLTGYEDGTENPSGEQAHQAALVHGVGSHLDGSSYMVLQPWLHDFTTFRDKKPSEQDNIIGRRKSDNEELDDAPSSAHVKRTAQEDFNPPAFILRRSMPWAHMPSRQGGLAFVAFGCSFDAFEAQMRRMVGLEDGVVDGLFQFSRPLFTAYYWCPPLWDGALDLQILNT